MPDPAQHLLALADRIDACGAQPVLLGVVAPADLTHLTRLLSDLQAITQDAADTAAELLASPSAPARARSAAHGLAEVAVATTAAGSLLGRAVRQCAASGLPGETADGRVLLNRLRLRLDGADTGARVRTSLADAALTARRAAAALPAEDPVPLRAAAALRRSAGVRPRTTPIPVAPAVLATVLPFRHR
ncbi:hypothetical protein [Streptacidiphilus neutrinimicus]|uniref:hypothetical protein n=1 Tax=Streptacidiphilus neutrinimicus TaxID=105420 RepID=UPI0005AA7BE0|nr:hypothetical protein [Streptacidiphilus neutrinimicus]